MKNYSKGEREREREIDRVAVILRLHSVMLNKVLV